MGKVETPLTEHERSSVIEQSWHPGVRRLLALYDQLLELVTQPQPPPKGGQQTASTSSAEGGGGEGRRWLCDCSACGRNAQLKLLMLDNGSVAELCDDCVGRHMQRIRALEQSEIVTSAAAVVEGVDVAGHGSDEEPTLHGREPGQP